MGCAVELEELVPEIRVTIRTHDELYPTLRRSVQIDRCTTTILDKNDHTLAWADPDADTTPFVITRNYDRRAGLVCVLDCQDKWI